MPNPFDQFDAAGPYIGAPLTGPKVAPPHVVESNVDYIIKPDGTATPRPGGPKDPNTKSDALGDYTKTGDAFLATVPANLRNLIKMYASNKLTPPTRPSDKVQLILDAAAQYDPAYDPALSSNRAKAIKDFTGHGPDALVVGSVNRLASHISDMFDASEKMAGPNLGFAPLNSLVAGAGQSFEPALTAKYDAAKPFVAAELDKIAKGTGGQTTVQGISEAMVALGRARSLDERRAAFGQLASIVHGALDPIQQRWESAYGGTKAPPMWISPAAANVFRALDPNNSDTYNGEVWRGLPGLKGDGTPGQATGFGPPPGGAPPGTPPGTPPTVMSGGPAQTVATGATRNQLDPQRTSALNGYIHAGAPYSAVKAWQASQPGSSPIDERVYNSAVAYARTPAGRNANLAEVTTQQPNSILNRAMASPLATFATQAANATSGGFLDEIGGAAKSLVDGGSLSDNIAQANAAKQAQAALNPNSALAGNVLGGAAAMFGGGALLKGAAKGTALGRSALKWAAEHPFLATTGGDAAYGSAYGVGEGNDNRLAGAGIGALAGAAGSVAGQGVARAASKAMTGIVNPAADLLRARGIPLTVGEIMGGGAKKLQDAAMSVPGPGDMIARRYADGREALNRAAFNEAGAITGTPIDAVGGEGLSRLAGAKNTAFSNALDPISLDLNSPSFVQDMGATLNRARALPTSDNAQGHALDALGNYVGGAVDANGQMSGNAFQQAYRGLSREAKPTPKAFSHDVGQTLQQGKNDLVGALQDQHPGAFDQFVAANNTNRHLSVLTDAVQRAQKQIGDNGEPLFTPAQLGSAGTKSENTYGTRLNAAMGDKPFGDLSAAAQQIMSSKVPDSGTALRELAQRALIGGGLAAGAGGAGYAGGGGEGAAAAIGIPAAAMTLLGTRMGQAALTGLLIKRPDLIKTMGQGLLKQGNVAGALGTSYAVPQSLLGLSGR